MIPKRSKTLIYSILMIAALTVVFCLLSGCITSGVQDDLKRITDMTSKEKGVWFLGVYNSQDRDYRNMVARSDLTNDQKEILREKKKIMVQVYPMIKIYNTYIDSGAIPTKLVEDQIIQLINDLSGLIVPMLE